MKYRIFFTQNQYLGYLIKGFIVYLLRKTQKQIWLNEFYA